MVTTSNLSTNATVPSESVAKPARLLSVDLLRGLVMVIMALDHTRDFFTYLNFRPEDLTHTYGALFFTRFITHYCAPTFFLLAGTGAYLSVSRGKTIGEVSRFFWTRGLWLVFLELTVLDFGWGFVFPLYFAVVIWALGWSMVLMALIVRLPVRWIAALGILIIATHNLLDGIRPAAFGSFSWLWTILHSPGRIPIVAGGFFIMYPIVPWVGVMACGYALGALLQAERKKWVFPLGLALTVAFFVLRGLNLYGNGTAGAFAFGPWQKQPSFVLSVIAFFDVVKYPPSLDYLLITLGPALMVLAGFGKVKAEKGLAKILLVYGRVPLFYYTLHIYLIHCLAIIIAVLLHQPAKWLLHGAFALGSTPPGYGHGLPFIYLIWLTVVAILYLPCKWFMEFKRRHRDWGWLSYF